MDPEIFAEIQRRLAEIEAAIGRLEARPLPGYQISAFEPHMHYWGYTKPPSGRFVCKVCGLLK